MATLPVELCLPGPEIGDVRVRPGGRFVSAVVSGTIDGTVPARLTMWDIATGEPADQGLIEKSRTPLLLEKTNP